TAIRRAVSSFSRRPLMISAPAAIGFMPTAGSPFARAAASRAQLMWVLPISVSVPVMNQADMDGFFVGVTWLRKHASLGCPNSLGFSDARQDIGSEHHPRKRPGASATRLGEAI